jgi:hypothetical protein
VRPLRLLSVEAPESFRSSFLFVLGTLLLLRFFLLSSGVFLPASGRGDLFFLSVMERRGIVLDLLMAAGFRATGGDCLHSVVLILCLLLKRGAGAKGVVPVDWFDDRLLGPDVGT